MLTQIVRYQLEIVRNKVRTVINLKYQTKKCPQKLQDIHGIVKKSGQNCDKKSCHNKNCKNNKN